MHNYHISGGNVRHATLNDNLNIDPTQHSTTQHAVCFFAYVNSATQNCSTTCKPVIVARWDVLVSDWWAQALLVIGALTRAVAK